LFLTKVSIFLVLNEGFNFDLLHAETTIKYMFLMNRLFFAKIFGANKKSTIFATLLNETVTVKLKIKGA